MSRSYRPPSHPHDTAATLAPEGPTRRSFLKMSTAGVLAPGVLAESLQPSAIAEKPCGPRASVPSPPVPESLSSLVNLLQGTDSSPEFSRGNTLPLVALPFGMAHWTLQTTHTSPWFFHPRDRRLQGIRCTHQLSPWIGDYGYATILPFHGDLLLAPEERASSYRPDRLELTPSWLNTFLERSRIQLSLVPSTRCALIRAAFPEGVQPGWIVDLPGSDSELSLDASRRIVIGRTTANSGGLPPGFATWYALRLDRNVNSFEVREIAGTRVAAIRLASGISTTALLRVGTSFISAQQALQNVDTELGQRSLEDLATSSRDVWDQQLAVARVSGGTAEQRSIFTSALYRAFLFPRTMHEVDAGGVTLHRSPYNGNVCPGVLYADHCFWDVYRAWYPMMSLLDPQRTAEILQGWIHAATEGSGWFPQAPSPGYRKMMTGSPSDSIFADAISKGLQGFDHAAAYAILRRNAFEPGDPARGFGRAGLDLYKELGYVPADRVHEGGCETLDAAYGDFCIAQAARFLGHTQDARELASRAANWRNLFDPKTRFLRGRRHDGTWMSATETFAQFDPFAWGGPFAEGSPWQYRFAVPHDLPGMFAALGGPEETVRELDRMLSLEPRFDVGSYAKEIHEMSEMAAVDFGQYAHSNQPVHHVLFLYTYAGRPDRTQFWTRRVLDHLYTLDAFPGDEDTGSMSAWYVLAAAGLYQVCPGLPEYTLTGPLFDAATIRRSGGPELRIISERFSPQDRFLQTVHLNGTLRTAHTVRHDELFPQQRPDTELLLRLGACPPTPLHGGTR